MSVINLGAVVRCDGGDPSGDPWPLCDAVTESKPNQLQAIYAAREAGWYVTSAAPQNRYHRALCPACRKREGK